MSALVLSKVTVTYGGRMALDGVSTSLKSGVVTGIVGPNGAGKTTLFRAALGLLPLVRGDIALLGRPLRAWSRDGIARAVAYLPQGGTVAWPMTAFDVVALGRLPHVARAARPTQEDCLVVREALARCDATAFAARRVNELSAGERSRVLLARAIATGAPVLLADEPAAHLDPAHQLALMGLLRDEAERGTAVAITLHDLSLASRHCDEILLLDKGYLVAAGPPEDTLGDANLASVFGVTALRAREEPGAREALVPIRRI